MIDIKEGNNLMLLPLDKIINTTESEENIEDDEENNEFRRLMLYILFLILKVLTEMEHWL